MEPLSMAIMATVWSTRTSHPTIIQQSGQSHRRAHMLAGAASGHHDLIGKVIDDRMADVDQHAPRQRDRKGRISAKKSQGASIDLRAFRLEGLFEWEQRHGKEKAGGGDDERPGLHRRSLPRDQAADRDRHHRVSDGAERPGKAEIQRPALVERFGGQGVSERQGYLNQQDSAAQQQPVQRPALPVSQGQKKPEDHHTPARDQQEGFDGRAFFLLKTIK